MTELLKKALEEVTQLSKIERDGILWRVLEDLQNKENSANRNRVDIVADKKQEYAVELIIKAVNKISSLPENEQNLYAKRIIDEVEDEKKWNESFSKSQNKLAKMAEKVEKDIADGKTYPLDLSE